MQSESKTDLGLDGPGKGKYKASQKLPWDWMVQGRVSAVEVHKSAGNGLLREEEVI